MRLVVALGGNALDANTRAGERARITRTAQQLGDLCLAGHEVIVTHGNGPQVGELLLDQEARIGGGRARPLRLDVLVAMTQAQLGYRLQQTLITELRGRGDGRGVVAVVTQVVVAVDDPAFSRPTKPIGPRYEERPGGSDSWARTSNGRWRRVVPSPRPQEIVERDALRAIVAEGIVPICAGGGGVPVVAAGERLRGVEAVVDKDTTSALLCSDLDAETLLILTDVDAVHVGYGTPDARPLARLTVGDARDLVVSGEAAAGSMAPKLLAAARVVEEGRGAVICRLGEAAAGLAGTAGTRLVPGPASGDYRRSAGEPGPTATGEPRA
ncbi:MAG: carbamate kinase [Actinobacteria bacterium]|nr:carbamate kinase [Actinomycetota bacterium]